MKRVRWEVPVAAATILVGVCPAPAAPATPLSGVELTTLAQATVDGIDYTTKQITIAPGGSTGWHYHRGQVFGVIRQGTLTHNRADCSLDGSYPAGAPITEGSGPDNVHVGRNLGPDPVIMWAVYVNPAGDPLSTDTPNPGCPFE